MSVLSEMLQEEYDRINDSLDSLIKNINALPKGSIVMKKINNKEQPYLQWREGDKVKSKYIKSEELNQIQNEVARRKEFEHNLKSIKKRKKGLEKVVGKEL